METKKVSVIIAAKNEEPRIPKVLEVVCNHSAVSEVIVVDDGSVDKTVEVAKRYKATVLTQNDQLGKTLAVRRGLEVAKGDIILLVDADLEHLTSDNVTKLLQPVLEGKVDWTLSLRGNSSHIYRWFKMDFVSGERAIRREILNDDEIWSKPHLGYGLEFLMNDSFLKRDLTFVSVDLRNLYAPRKYEKLEYQKKFWPDLWTYWKGYWADFAMVFNMFRAFPMLSAFAQFFRMAYLSQHYRKTLLKPAVNPA